MELGSPSLGGPVDEGLFARSMAGSTRSRWRRREDLLREGQPIEHVHLLQVGFVSRYRVLPDGRRQVLPFAVRGDLIGFPCFAAGRATATSCGLTDVVALSVPVESFVAALETDPGFATAVARRAARDLMIAAERIVALGRRTADERVAYFALELHTSLRSARLADDHDFAFPLTQELIADATGLSTPHVNRVLAALRRRGLLAIEGGRVRLLDPRRLALLASVDQRPRGPAARDEAA